MQDAIGEMGSVWQISFPPAPVARLIDNGKISGEPGTWPSQSQLSLPSLAQQGAGKADGFEGPSS
jgi:hypothetical protein